MALLAADKKFEDSGVAPLMTSLLSSPPPMLENMPRTPRLQLASPDSGDGLLRKRCTCGGGASPLEDNFLFFAGVSCGRFLFFAILSGQREQYIHNRIAGYQRQITTTAILGPEVGTEPQKACTIIGCFANRQREAVYVRKRRGEQGDGMSRLFKARWSIPSTGGRTHARYEREMLKILVSVNEEDIGEH